MGTDFGHRFWAQISVAGFGRERILADAHVSASDLFVLPQVGTECSAGERRGASSLKIINQ